MENFAVPKPQQKPPRRFYSAELKLAAVKAVVEDNKTYRATVDEFDISSVSTLKKWLIAYRKDGECSLYPKPLGRPRGIHTPIVTRLNRFDDALLRMENEKLVRKLGG
ncbi:MAG: transposase [Raoultibacter sp.]